MKKLLFIPLFLFSQNFNSYLNFMNKEYTSYNKNLQKEFNEYVKTLNEEFRKYQKELSKYWKNPELSSKKIFVEYSKDKKVKKKVDFEKKYIEVAVISKSKENAVKKIKTAIKSLSKETIKEAFKNNPVLVKVDKKFSKIGKSSRLPNKYIIKDIISPQKIIQKIKNIKTKSSKIPNTKVYFVKIPIPSNFYLKKAKEYKNEVFSKSDKFKLPSYLIYAVIHTESSYNPMARSYVPAFGLMQVVPQTAGRDVAKTLFGKPMIFTPSYLYNPSNNILIGSGYLHKIYYVYFKEVNNPLSRLFLTIAAYNTGPGNVACAFNSSSKDFKGKTICKRSRGDYSIKKALPKINSLSPREVYNQLINNLRYDEARNYLKKVWKRSLMYKKNLDKI